MTTELPIRSCHVPCRQHPTEYQLGAVSHLTHRTPVLPSEGVVVIPWPTICARPLSQGGERASDLGAGSCLGLLCDTSERLAEAERSLLNVLFAEQSLVCFGNSLHCAPAAEGVSSRLQERAHRLTLSRHVLQEQVYHTRVTVLACVMHRWQVRPLSLGCTYML